MNGAVRLGIDSRDAFAPRPRGVGKSLAMLLRRLLPRLEGWDVRLYTRRDDGARWSGARVRRIDLRGDRIAAWENIRLPIAALQDRLDLLHCPGQTMSYLAPCPIVLTVHDVIPLRIGDGWSRGQVAAFRRALGRAVHRARRIIAVSHFTKRDLLDLFPVAEDKIDVVPWGIEAPAAPSPPAAWAALSQTHRIRGPFFVCFGGDAPRKNVPRILEAFGRFLPTVGRDAQLVLLGVTGRAETAYRGLADRLGVADNVVVLGYVDDRAVAALLERAEALVFTSLYEGFGLPILEAMAVGTPVITSNVTSMPEVAGDAAILVDPTDPEAIAAAIHACYANDRRRADLRARGLDRVRSFSWDRAAGQTLATYGRALGLEAEACVG